jgi:hypothetical protein
VEFIPADDEKGPGLRLSHNHADRDARQISLREELELGEESLAVGPNRSDEVSQSFGQGRRGWAGKPKPDRHPNPAKPLQALRQVKSMRPPVICSR